MILGLYKPENKIHTGKRLSEIASVMGKDWIDTIIDLILSEQQGIGTIYFMMTEENLKLQMRQPWIKFGTDAGGEDAGVALLREPGGQVVHAQGSGLRPRARAGPPVRGAVRRGVRGAAVDNVKELTR